MRHFLLSLAALIVFAGIARAQTRVQSDVPLTRVDVEARSVIRSLTAAPSADVQEIMEEILIVADTSVGTEYFLFTQPGDGTFSGIDRSAVRFTPSFDGQIIYVAYFLAGGEDNPAGAGRLRISLAGMQNDGGWIMPAAFVDSADVDFGDLRAGDLNYLITLDNDRWEVRQDEDFFITFEVMPESATSHIDFVVDDGSEDSTDVRYFPARTVLYGDFSPPDDGWFYRFVERNNQVVAVAVANLLAPELVAPADSAEGLGDEVTFVWNTASRSQTYRIQVTDDRSFETVEQEYVATDTMRTITGLSPSTDYVWRVRAENDLGESPWSRFGRFTTSTTSSAEREQPDVIVSPILHVYPNPSEGAARISLQLQQADAVRLHAYDVLGRLVEVIYEGTLTRGEHGFEFRTTIHVAGAIFLRAEVGSRSVVRSLLIP